MESKKMPSRRVLGNSWLLETPLKAVPPTSSQAALLQFLTKRVSMNSFGTSVTAQLAEKKPEISKKNEKPLTTDQVTMTSFPNQLKEVYANNKDYLLNGGMIFIAFALIAGVIFRLTA